MVLQHVVSSGPEVQEGRPDDAEHVLGCHGIGNVRLKPVPGMPKDIIKNGTIQPRMIHMFMG